MGKRGVFFPWAMGCKTGNALSVSEYHSLFLCKEWLEKYGYTGIAVMAGVYNINVFLSI